ncbi:complement decay-accelerating factor-like [Crassostrea angulata]|uniref:complement decay-accelerating factor-like n=1 Tax=Magallana angulata TaxID=2784310 RepID=UPI0022B18336|nr:complement decay-accelerating factor-like [Crassostrea angulata]
MMDKNNINTTFPTIDNVKFDSSYSLTSTIVSVQMKVFTPNNAGFVFYAGGSAMIDTSLDRYGAIIYGYTETEVFLWRPGKDTSNGYLVYVGGKWGNGESSQQASIVEVTVKVIDFDGVCQLPPDIPNADVTVNNNTARYFCNPGYYQLEDTDDFISFDNNNWQPTNFECIQICEAPLPIPNAEVMRFNNRAMYSCREGYRSMSGSNIINCTASKWQTTTFSCYALSCGPAPNITNADVLVNDDGAMYDCDYGYIPSNTNNRIVCNDSVWSLTDFKCLSTYDIHITVLYSKYHVIVHFPFSI